MPFEESYLQISSNDLLSHTDEFENCTFKQCDFSDARLSNMIFIECEFIECNLSNALMSNTSFQNVIFDNCKIVGVHFEHDNPVGVQLNVEECFLDHASLYQMKVSCTRF